jgi:hypothetical protein
MFQGLQRAFRKRSVSFPAVVCTSTALVLAWRSFEVDVCTPLSSSLSFCSSEKDVCPLDKVFRDLAA